MAMTVREVIRLIERTVGNWWRRAGVIGNTSSPSKPGRVMIAEHRKDDLAPGTLNSILRQAGLKE